MFKTIPDQIKSRHTPVENDQKFNKVYQAHQSREVNLIKKEIEESENLDIYFGKNWIRLNGKTHNGITKKMFEEILNNSCNIATNVL